MDGYECEYRGYGEEDGGIGKGRSRESDGGYNAEDACDFWKGVSIF
jgi:hypothetical protein